MKLGATKRRALIQRINSAASNLAFHIGVDFKPGDSIDNLIETANTAPDTNKTGRPKKPFILTKGEGNEKQTIEAFGIAGVSRATGFTDSESTLRRKVEAGELVNGWKVTPAGE